MPSGTTGWFDTLKTTALVLVTIGAVLAVGSIWISYTESLWRVTELGTMMVLTFRVSEHRKPRRRDSAVVALLCLLVILGSPAFGIL